MKDWTTEDLDELIHQARKYRNALDQKQAYEKEFQVWGDESFAVEERDAHRKIELMFESKKFHDE